MSKRDLQLNVTNGHSALLLLFMWQGDRYRHQLCVERDEQEPIIVQSCEGDGQANWPPSPALQQVMPHSATGSPGCLLALGMAGSTHWSVSAEAQAEPPGLRLDCAARIHRKPAWIGITYRVSGGTVSGLRSGASICDPGGNRRLLISPAEESCRIEAELPDVFRIRVVAESLTPPATVRWACEFLPL